jgi:hypothetical protein
MKRRSAPKDQATEMDTSSTEQKVTYQPKELRKYDNSFSQYDVNVEPRSAKCMRCAKAIAKDDLAYFFYSGEKGSKAHFDCFFPWYVIGRPTDRCFIYCFVNSD